MARTIRIKLYKFNELSDEAKSKAIFDYVTGDDSHFSTAWDDIKEDAKMIGLKLISLSDRRPNEGEFITSPGECVEAILLNHGATCDTYQTASKYKNSFQNTSDEVNEEELEEAEDDFLQEILEDYRIMYNKQMEYEESNEYAIEMIEANEYEFTKDGNRF